jgi:hypothetical protein
MIRIPKQRIEDTNAVMCWDDIGIAVDLFRGRDALALNECIVGPDCKSLALTFKESDLCLVICLDHAKVSDVSFEFQEGSVLENVLALTYSFVFQTRIEDEPVPILVECFTNDDDNIIEHCITEVLILDKESLTAYMNGTLHIVRDVTLSEIVNHFLPCTFEELDDFWQIERIIGEDD